VRLSFEFGLARLSCRPIYVMPVCRPSGCLNVPTRKRRASLLILNLCCKREMFPMKSISMCKCAAKSYRRLQVSAVPQYLTSVPDSVKRDFGTNVAATLWQPGKNKPIYFSTTETALSRKRRPRCTFLGCGMIAACAYAAARDHRQVSRSGVRQHRRVYVCFNRESLLAREACRCARADVHAVCGNTGARCRCRNRRKCRRRSAVRQE
jgi:hypothetical protein